MRIRLRELAACRRRFAIDGSTFCSARDFTRECLGLVADTSISGVRVARELDGIVAHRGRPASIVSDNGTELTSMVILRYRAQRAQMRNRFYSPLDEKRGSGQPRSN